MPEKKTKTNSRGDEDEINHVARQTEDMLYNEIVSSETYGDIVRNSSKRVYVYANLRSIFPVEGDKTRVLQKSDTIFKQLATVVVDSSNPLDAAKTLKSQGYHPLVMCASGHAEFQARRNQDRSSFYQDDELAVRTTALYPLRSRKYQNVSKMLREKKKTRKTKAYSPKTVRQCRSVYLPHLVLFRGPREEGFPVWEWEDCCTVEVGMVSGIQTAQHLSVDDRAKIMRGKLNCLMDMAVLQQKRAQEHKDKDEDKEVKAVDALVLTDLYCTTPEMVDAYVKAVGELLTTYLHRFRILVFAFNQNDKLLQALRDSVDPENYPLPPLLYPDGTEVDEEEEA